MIPSKCKFLPNNSTHDIDVDHKLINLEDTPSSYDDGCFLMSTESGTEWEYFTESAISEILYISDDLTSSTSNTELTNKLRLEINNLTSSGTYRIGWYYEWAYSSSSSEFVFRSQLDDDINLNYTMSRPVPADIDSFRGSSGFCYVTLTSGSHYIDMDWCSSTNGRYAVIRRARIDAWRLL